MRAHRAIVGLGASVLTVWACGGSVIEVAGGQGGARGGSTSSSASSAASSSSTGAASSTSIVSSSTSSGSGGAGGSTSSGSGGIGGSGGSAIDGGPPDGCVPTTCTELGYMCGPASDGCGKTLDCGTCPPDLMCGVGCTPGQCGDPGCVP